MQLSIKAFALACGILFAVWMLLAGIVAVMFPDWGTRFMDVVGAFYPGVGGVAFGQVIVATLYALVDGLVGGAVFAWLYNRLVAPAPSAEPTV